MSKRDRTGVPRTTFKNGVDFCPFIGLGTVQGQDEVKDSVRTAIQLGYRHIDCAMLHQNEKEIGEVLNEMTSPETGIVSRSDLFITSKVWATHMRYEKTIESCLQSIKDLQCNYLDLYLIHLPFSLKEGDELFPKEDGNEDKLALSDVSFFETWKALEQLVDEGKVRFIGVSNFNTKQLDRLLKWPDLRYKPVCNQIEISPYYINSKLLNYCQMKDIHVVGYSPFGSPGSPCVKEQSLLKNEVIGRIADSVYRTPAQVILRWAVQRLYSAIPKSSNPEHLKLNLQVFDFSLTDSQMSKISNLNKNAKAVSLDAARHSTEYPFDDDIDPEIMPNLNINNIKRLC